MKSCIEDVLNGTIGVLEEFKDRSREFVKKGEQNNGPVAKVLHEIFSNDSEATTGRVKSWIGRGLHIMNIATLEDLETLKKDWDRRPPAPGSSDTRASG
ncbi:MAG: hypothetical protein ACYCYP_06315 [Leptospirales bacterium]